MKKKPIVWDDPDVIRLTNFLDEIAKRRGNTDTRQIVNVALSNLKI